MNKCYLFLVLFCHSGTDTTSYWKQSNKHEMIILLEIPGNGKVLLCQLITHEFRCLRCIFRFSQDNPDSWFRDFFSSSFTSKNRSVWMTDCMVSQHKFECKYHNVWMIIMFKQLYQMPHHITNLCFLSSCNESVTNFEVWSHLGK